MDPLRDGPDERANGGLALCFSSACPPFAHFAESRCMSTDSASSPTHRKLWEERSVVVSFILAVLAPGLGHLYQGRVLKGLIYLVGILGLFIWGVQLGEGVVVYNQPENGISRRVTLHYAAQFGAGLISYPALFQKKRLMAENNRVTSQVDQPLKAHFTGQLKSSDSDSNGGKLDGIVSLRPEKGEFGTETVGKFVGTLDGQRVELPLKNLYLDRPVAAGFHRTLKCGVEGTEGAIPGSGKSIVGWIPRSIIDGYGVPPDSNQLQELTGRLGKLHELALVFTWIAGLLNILAIWDCVQGPAYGFGDEVWSDPANADPSAQNKSPNPAPLDKTASPA